MLLFGSYSFGQISINHFPIKILIEESNKLLIDHVGKNNFMINYNQSFYFNTNLPNFENKNGYYFPKGFGSISGFLINYNTNHLQLTVEPTIFNIKLFPEEIYFLNQMPSEINIKYILIICFFSLLITFLATIFPSISAAKLDPIKALKYE